MDTFQEIIMHVDLIEQRTERDQVSILNEVIWHLEFFIRTQDSVEETLERKLELCRRLLRELLDSSQDSV
jgi:hypothetical protein